MITEIIAITGAIASSIFAFSSARSCRSAAEAAHEIEKKKQTDSMRETSVDLASSPVIKSLGEIYRALSEVKFNVQTSIESPQELRGQFDKSVDPLQELESQGSQASTKIVQQSL